MTTPRFDTQRPASVLANRRWVKNVFPYTYYTASNVFTPRIYQMFESAFREHTNGRQQYMDKHDTVRGDSDSRRGRAAGLLCVPRMVPR